MRSEIVLVFFTVAQPQRRSAPGARRERACEWRQKRARKGRTPAPEGDAATKEPRAPGGRTLRPRDPEPRQAQREPMPGNNDRQRDKPRSGIGERAQRPPQRA